MNPVIARIVKIAEEFQWKLASHSEENRFLRFCRDDLRVDVWYTSGTIGVYEPHKEARFLKGILKEEELVEIFANPLTA